VGNLNAERQALAQIKKRARRLKRPKARTAEDTLRYIVGLLDPIVGGDNAPVEVLVRRIIARATPNAGDGQ